MGRAAANGAGGPDGLSGGLKDRLLGCLARCWVLSSWSQGRDFWFFGVFWPALGRKWPAKWPRIVGASCILQKEPMPRQLISSGSIEQEIGYSRAVVDGDWVFAYFGELLEV